jgi:enoyl-CoA hydratase
MSSNPDPLPDAPPVLLDRDGDVGLLTLNRPDRLNAVNLSLYEGLSAGITELGADDAVRAIVLTGAGGAFCAGADLKAHREREMTAEERRVYVRAAQLANLRLRRSPKPVVAAVHGAAVGGGLELALSCDFAIVASDGKLRLPEVALGTFVGGGITRDLPRRVGLTRARELLLLGDFFSGGEAAAMGLAFRAMPATQVLAASLELAHRLACLAPVPLLHARRLLARSGRMTLMEAMRAEASALEAIMGTEDWREGVRAFAEKRPPRYHGR